VVVVMAGEEEEECWVGLQARGLCWRALEGCWLRSNASLATKIQSTLLLER